MYQIGPQCNEVDRTRLKRPNGPNWTELDWEGYNLTEVDYNRLKCYADVLQQEHNNNKYRYRL